MPVYPPLCLLFIYFVSGYCVRRDHSPRRRNRARDGFPSYHLHPAPRACTLVSALDAATAVAVAVGLNVAVAPTVGFALGVDVAATLVSVT